MSLELLDALDEVLEDLTVILALDAAEAAGLGVASEGLGVIVLREGAHLHRALSGVVAHDAGEDDGVGQAVDVVVGTELVGHGVVDAEEGVGEGHAGEAGGVGHVVTGLNVGAVVIGALEVVEDELHGAKREAVGVVGRHDGGCSRTP